MFCILPKTLRSLPYIVLVNFLFISLLFPLFSGAQCASVAGPNPPSAATTQTFTGSAFSYYNPTNVYAADGSVATTFALLSLFGGNSDYIIATGFNFSIPTYATICGVQVDVKRLAGGIGIFASVKDNKVFLVKNGVMGTTSKASGTDWTGIDTWQSYGANGDKWGMVIDDSDVNKANFGVAISAKLAGLSVAPTAQIDAIQITIFYDATVLPIKIASFSAVAVGNNVQVNWEDMETQMGTTFIVGRSINGRDWENIDSVVTGGGGVVPGHYAVTDYHPVDGHTFYRLTVLRMGSAAFYSDVQAVDRNNTPVLKIYPDPATDFINISNTGVAKNITITDIAGRICAVLNHPSPDGINRINTNELEPGIYFVTVNNRVQRFLKR